MPANRPYLKMSIAQLESLHAAEPDDLQLGTQLLEELNHRNTGRAASLQQRIEAKLRAHSAAKSADGSVQHRESAAGDAHKESSTDRRRATTSGVKPNIADGHTSKFDRENEPQAILSTWIAFEALSPQTYRRPVDLANGDQRCVAKFVGNTLPWYQNERSRPKQQLYYQVVLGSIPMDRATDALIAAFGEDEERSRRELEKAPIAVILLDRTGKVLEESSVAISSFAWALPIALHGDLAHLGNWPDVEHRLVSELTERLRRRDRDGELLPLDGAAILAAFQWLVDTLRLPAEMVEAPSFALRVFHYFKSKNPPEVALLNSFFLRDLTRADKALQSGQAGEALARYLGAKQVQHSPDLLSNRAVIESLIAPCKMPATRWPGPGGHPLVALQQAAVNAIRSEFASGRPGIAAVNGPPGTGKTTLLRDVVAACVLDRAGAMAGFDDPLDAFSTTGQKVAAGDRAFLHLYRLDEKIKGHEVVIASSNNRAVENVSKELPAAKAIGRELRYFQTISDRLQSQRSADDDVVPGETSWGLIAAVLGNAANRNAFQQAIWWDDDKSLRLYLKAAKGDAVFREVTDAEGNLVSREIPTVVADEQPPTPEQAKKNWKKVRQSFHELQREVNAELQQLEKVRQDCLQLPVASLTSLDAEAAHRAAATTLARRVADVRAAAAAQESAQASLNAIEQRRRARFADRPGWIARLFHTARYRAWQDHYSPCEAEARTLAQQLREVGGHLRRAQESEGDAQRNLQHAAEAAEIALKELRAIHGRIDSHRNNLGNRIVDTQFFDRGHDEWNLSSPWIPDALHRKREDLFALALDVHRAFIDVGAQKISHNLGALMGAMQTGAFPDEAKKSLLGDLWSTLFLIIPAISTTFASVERMLGDLPPSALGWLLVDEAGQATPQSAVGAILRAKHVIVVGDPLQVPPVVTLPEKLVTELCNYFKISVTEWGAPAASAQTVADRASHYQAEFKADVGVRQVGLPLLVHRRCEEPMFGVSNRIAYDGQMVHAVESTDGAIARTLGPSAWINVDGIASTKWCQAEGDIVVRMLDQLASAGALEPDLYIITPFRIVAHELRRHLEAHRYIFERFEVDCDEWLRNRVGTIHTFQGKEAEAVIAVLGAPMAAQQGARRWATAAPNILNVMVSRAKKRLYVVGSRAAWGQLGHASEMAQALPNSPP
ncbi:DNA2/NAM7 helicase-like C-terminal domain-containing protein (plasmid) [Cupriavidus necator]|uniref:DEAD/DEAH box helicase n=1 Tax=Cupriavidus necator TaxID=106590 RepID=UPI003F7368B9